MIGIVIATHGSMASGIESALSLLAGSPEAMATVELHPGMSPDSFSEKVRGAITSVDSGDGVLVLLDIFGGTPSNVTCRLLGEGDVYAVAGVNLAMAIDAVFGRAEEKCVADLGKRVAASASSAVIDVCQTLASAAEDDDDELDF